jgi:hypothetical protein
MYLDNVKHFHRRFQRSLLLFLHHFSASESVRGAKSEFDIWYCGMYLLSPWHFSAIAETSSLLTPTYFIHPVSFPVRKLLALLKILPPMLRVGSDRIKN